MTESSEAEALRQEVREARAALAHYVYLPSVEARDLRASGSGCCFALEHHLAHPEAGVKVEATRAELRVCLEGLAALATKRPAPKPLPEYRVTGAMLPVNLARRFRPRVVSKWDVFAPRGRR